MSIQHLPSPSAGKTRPSYLQPAEKTSDRRRTRAGMACAILAFAAVPYSVAQASDITLMRKTRNMILFSDSRIQPNTGGGVNILLMGTDHRDTITKSERKKFYAGGQACGCSDTMMLVHLSEHGDRATVISIPRDSYAIIPQHEGRYAHPARINAAYQEGGAVLAMRTVESMAGVRIDRYLQIDFRRFIDAVNAVDGVEVCTDRPLSDSSTHLDLQPGKHLLHGGPALQYVRSRKTDTSADLGRSQRQQRFLVSALEKIQQANFDDLNSMSKVGRALLGEKTDSDLSLTGLIDLTRKIRTLVPAQTEFTTVPIERFKDVPGVGSTLVWEKKKSSEIFSKINSDQPLTAPGSTNRLTDPPEFFVHEAARGNTLSCAQARPGTGHGG